MFGSPKHCHRPRTEFHIRTGTEFRALISDKAHKNVRFSSAKKWFIKENLWSSKEFDQTSYGRSESSIG